MTAPVDLAEPNYRTLLLGMKQMRTYHFRIVVQGAAGECAGADQTIATGPLPNILPTLDVMNVRREALAPQVGIGAVKYADLSVAHDSEYVFDLDRMVALHGNTSRYLQYAVARTRSVLRKADEAAGAGAVTVTEPEERALVLALLDFGDVVAEVGRELEPHRLCTYLFELAQTFSVFYEQCPILTAEPAVRASRLTLARLTGDVLTRGLHLLGIETPETM